MTEYYCQNCQQDKWTFIKKNIQRGEILDNDSKRKKFNKHTNSTPGGKGMLSIFSYGTSDRYADDIYQALETDDSFLMRSNDGKYSLICPSTNFYGDLFYGQENKGKTDTLIIAKSTDRKNYHSYSDIFFNRFPNAYCALCNKKLGK